MTKSIHWFSTKALWVWCFSSCFDSKLNKR